MDKTTTTITIFASDRAWLDRLFGKPVHAAFHKLRQLCPHPEGQRRYSAAVVREDGQAFSQLEPNAKTITLLGFHCGACDQYVFPGSAGQ
jgi:hypothetical protein